MNRRAAALLVLSAALPAHAERLGTLTTETGFEEEGHADLAISEARASYERLAAAGPFADCGAARRALLGESLRIRQRQAFVHAHYDRVTRFGTRQYRWTRTAETPVAPQTE